MSDYILKIGNLPMSWCGNKQSNVVISLIEAKYCALMEGTKYVIWLRRLSREIKHEKPRLLIIFYNNIKNIKSCKNLVFHTRTKHIEWRYHFVHEKIMFSEINITHTTNNQQHVDIPLVCKNNITQS
jgi:hypothetical protein